MLLAIFLMQPHGPPLADLVVVFDAEVDDGRDYIN